MINLRRCAVTRPNLMTLTLIDAHGLKRNTESERKLIGDLIAICRENAIVKRTKPSLLRGITLVKFFPYRDENAAAD